MVRTKTLISELFSDVKEEGRTTRRQTQYPFIGGMKTF
jgi:hypothetical protein